MKKSTILLLLTITVLFSCKNRSAKNNDQVKASLLIECNNNLSEAIITDIFTPPVASRIYAYSNIAAYEALVNFYPSSKPLSGRLNKLAELPKPDKEKEYDIEITALAAFSAVAKKLVFSEYIIEDFRKVKHEQLTKNVNS